MRIFSILLLFCFLIMPVCVFAQEDGDSSVKKEKVKKEKVKKEKVKKEKDAEEADASAEETSKELEKYEDPFKDAPKKIEVIQPRTFEVGFNYNLSFSNTFFSIFDLFKDTIKINIDDLSKGIIFDFSTGIRPFYFMYDSHKGWGFGLSTDIDAFGIADLSNALLSLEETDGEDSTIGGSVFVSAGIDTFFHIKNFKIKLRPALFYTVAYLKTDVTYTYFNTDEGTEFYVDYEGRLYTAFPVNDDKQPNALTGTPGLDLSVGAEYPLSKALGISNSIFDFDVGVDFINIPIISSTLENYKKFKGRIGTDEPINVLDENGMGDLFSSFDDFDKEAIDGTGSYKVERPFKMLLHAKWRPGGKQSFSVIPVFGFAYNQLFLDPFGVEAGINLRLSAADMFIFLFGVNYTDRAWNNSLDFALNFRAVEFNIGAKMRSRDFVKSWTGHGIGINMGIKLGY